MDDARKALQDTKVFLADVIDNLSNNHQRQMGELKAGIIDIREFLESIAPRAPYMETRETIAINHRLDLLNGALRALNINVADVNGRVKVLEGMITDAAVKTGKQVDGESVKCIRCQDILRTTNDIHYIKNANKGSTGPLCTSCTMQHTSLFKKMHETDKKEGNKAPVPNPPSTIKCNKCGVEILYEDSFTLDQHRNGALHQTIAILCEECLDTLVAEEEDAAKAHCIYAFNYAKRNTEARRR